MVLHFCFLRYLVMESLNHKHTILQCSLSKTQQCTARWCTVSRRLTYKSARSINGVTVELKKINKYDMKRTDGGFRGHISCFTSALCKIELCYSSRLATANNNTSKSRQHVCLQMLSAVCSSLWFASALPIKNPAESLKPQSHRPRGQCLAIW